MVALWSTATARDSTRNANTALAVRWPPAPRGGGFFESLRAVAESSNPGLTSFYGPLDAATARSMTQWYVQA